jgi:predicted permease
MGLAQDLQFAVRLLVKDRWFTLAALLALAGGIGINATVFTFVNAVLIRGLPIPDSDRVMAIDAYEPARSRELGISYRDFIDIRDATRAFAVLAAYNGTTMNVADEGRPPERYAGVFISATAFGILHESPILGRGFVAEDDRPGAAPVAILGHALWTQRYGGDPNVIGHTVRINGRPATIVGVMREGFRFPSNADLWQPLSLIPQLEAQPRNDRRFLLFGRLADGATRADAQAELLAISQRLSRDHPETNAGIQVRVQTFSEQQNGGPIRAVFLSMMGAVVFVLLIACANVANLLLARSAHRAREMAVRVSVGASRMRIVRQLLIESLVLASAAGALGLALSFLGIRLFDEATRDVGRPYWIQFTVDGTVVGYLVAVCMATAIAFGLAPALHIARTDVNEVLKDGGRSGTAGGRARRWAGTLVIGELALTLALLAGAGFMMRNFINAYRLDVGVDTSRLLTSLLALPETKYAGAGERLAFYERLQERLRGRFAAVSVASNGPMQGGTPATLSIDGRNHPNERELPEVTMVAVDPHYFDTIDLPLQRGRVFTDADGRPGQETAIVNTRFAAMHFPNDDPLGRRITLRLPEGALNPGTASTLSATIVGIVPDVRQRAFSAREPDPVVYLPFRASPRGFMTLIARSDGDPRQLVPALREELRAVDPDLPLFNVRTLDESLAISRWPFRVFGTMFGIFAGIALLLSALGLYAVTAYAVAQRTQEIGIRSALGAQGSQIVWLFLRRACVHVGAGLALGIAGALGVGAIFEAADLLVQVDGRDPVTIGSITVLLLGVSFAASLWPLRHAIRLDPVAALRND